MRYVALLRGINVGGHRKVQMSDLRQLASGLGFDEPRTLLQSGNLIFAARKQSAFALERLLEREAETRLRLRTDFMVRNADDWEEVIGRNPFQEAATRDPGHLLVMFLKAPVRKGVVDELTRLNTGSEVIHAAGRELYIVFPLGIGVSKLPALMTEARLGTRGTGRNWNTVLKVRGGLRE